VQTGPAFHLQQRCTPLTELLLLLLRGSGNSCLLLWAGSWRKLWLVRRRGRWTEAVAVWPCQFGWKVQGPEGHVYVLSSFTRRVRVA
jgi:hypothetical protein